MLMSSYDDSLCTIAYMLTLLAWHTTYVVTPVVTRLHSCSICSVLFVVSCWLVAASSTTTACSNLCSTVPLVCVVCVCVCGIADSNADTQNPK